MILGVILYMDGSSYPALVKTNCIVENYTMNSNFENDKLCNAILNTYYMTLNEGYPVNYTKRIKVSIELPCTCKHRCFGDGCLHRDVCYDMDMWTYLIENHPIGSNATCYYELDNPQKCHHHSKTGIVKRVFGIIFCITGACLSMIGLALLKGPLEYRTIENQTSTSMYDEL